MIAFVCGDLCSSDVMRPSSQSSQVRAVMTVGFGLIRGLQLQCKKNRNELGLTYSFNQHGGVVYLTHFESILLMALIVSVALLIAVGGYIINNSRVAQR